MKDFTKYEFQERLNRMTELLKTSPGWGDAYESSTGQTLIQLMTHVTDELHYMLQRRTLENYIETASLRTSIIARACELGYRFKRAKANSGYVKFAIDVPATQEIIIPIYTRLTLDNVDYITIETGTIAIGETEVQVLTKQATLMEQSFTVDSTGIITLPTFEYIDNDILTVNTPTETFYDVRTQNNVNKRALSFLTPTDAFYDIKYSVGGMCIVFGDNIQGKFPDNPVTIQYAMVDENIDPLNTIGKVFTLVDENPFFVGYTVTVTNTTKIANGSAPESDMSIKRNAVDYHRSNGRAVTNDDYAYWVRNFDGVDIVDAKAIGEDELQTVVYNLNNVYLTYLTSSGEPLSTVEQQAIRDFMDTVKTSQAHLVFRPASVLDVQLDVDVRKGKTTPITDKEMYDILYQFFVDYFALGDGSIGKEHQSSDILNAMYSLTVNRNNLTYPVIDFAKLSIKGAVGLEVPIRTNRAKVKLDNSYVPTDGDFYTLRFDDTPIQVAISSTDSIFDIVSNMRTQILLNLRLSVTNQIGGMAYDYQNLPIFIESQEGGFSVTVNDNDSGDFAVIRSTFDTDIKAEHFYYGRLAERKPAIPVYNGTNIDFTAPSDTSVNVYSRTDINDPLTETLVTTLSPSQNYNNTYTGTEYIIFEYVSNSSEDAIATIIYATLDDLTFTLDIATDDNMGTFILDKNYGDLIPYVTIDYEITLPYKPDYSVYANAIGSEEKDVVLPGSINFLDTNGDIILTDNGVNQFVDNSGVIDPSLYVNYKTGVITLTDAFASGEYKITYSQNIFDNLSVSDNTVMRLIPPKPSLSSTEASISEIRIV
jgi:hypothetical protein